MKRDLSTIIDIKIRAHNETVGAINEIKKNLMDIEKSSKTISSSVSDYMVKNWDVLNAEIQNVFKSLVNVTDSYDKLGDSDAANKLANKITLLQEEFNRLVTIRNELMENPFGIGDSDVKIKDLAKNFSNLAKEAKMCSDETAKEIGKIGQSLDEHRIKVEENVNAIREFKRALTEKIDNEFLAEAEKYFDSLVEKSNKLNDGIKVVQEFRRTMSEKADAQFWVECEKYFDELTSKNEKLSESIKVVQDLKRAMAEKADADFFNEVSAEWEKESKEVEEHLKNINEQWQYMFGNTNGALDASALQLLAETGLEADNTKDNILELVKAFASLAIQGNLSATSIQGLLQNFGAGSVEILGIIALMKMASEGIEFLKNQYEEMTKSIKNMSNTLLNGLEGSVGLVSDAFAMLSDNIDGAIEKFREFNSIGAEAQQGYFTLYNYLGTAGDDIVDFTNNLEKLYKLDASKLVNSMRGILGMVSNMHLAKEEAQGIVKAFTVFGQDLSAFSGYSVEEVVGQLESAVNLGNIRITSPLIRALDLTKEDVEAFRELNSVEERAQYLLSKGEKVRGTYEKWLQTSAGKVERLYGSIEILNTSIGKLSTGLLAKLAPALTAIVDLVNKIISGIAEIINIDLTDIAGDTGEAVESYEDIAGAIDKIGESANKTKSKTRSFDDLISVNKDDASVEDALVGGFDVGAWADSIDDIDDEKTELEIILDEFYKLLSDKKYREAGKYLADSINNLLSDINWSDIKAKFHTGGAIIASVFSNILSNKDLFGNIGSVLGNGFNSLLYGISGFLFGDFDSMNPNGFDFEGFGEALANAWTEYWNTFDSQHLGFSLYGVFKGAVDFVNGWLTGGGLVSITENIGNTIVSFFTHFSEEDALDTANALVGLVDNAFDAVQNLLNNIKEHPEILQGIKNVIKSTLENIKNNSSEWGSTLNELITIIYDTASALLLDNKDLIAEGVGNFLEELDIVDIFFSWITMKLSLLWVKTQSWVDGLIEEVLGWLINPIGKIGELIVEKLYEIGSKAFTSFKDALKAGFSNFSLSDLSLGTNLGNSLGNWIAGGDFKIPWLAGGGIAYKATPAVIGDGGLEAVLPLTQNTGWAKQVADLINVNLSGGSGSSGGTIYVDMSGINKQFYTRSEMLDFGVHIIDALKLQGVKVASLV